MPCVYVLSTEMKFCVLVCVCVCIFYFYFFNFFFMPINCISSLCSPLSLICSLIFFFFFFFFFLRGRERLVLKCV